MEAIKEIVIAWARCVKCSEEWSVKSFKHGLCPKCQKEAAEKPEPHYWWND